MRVAIQGTRGSFSEAAARQQWADAEVVACREVGDVVKAVREGRRDGMPGHREFAGGLDHPTYDLLQEAFGDSKLYLSREILLPVHHAILGVRDGSLAQIRRVLSHPVALGQCRSWLSQHLPDAELVTPGTRP
jgi:prephenate dehydratase